jgi:hypothetical protein
MQGDLISKSELLESLNDWINENTDINTILRWIEEFEIAYNVEKVVAELEKMRECEDAGWCNYCQNKWCPLELLGADETIDIVRNGGKE